MLEVINASSGQNFSTSQIFPRYVATGKYDDSGGQAHIIKKDLDLFVRSAAAEGTPAEVISEAYNVIADFSETDPLQDQMRIYQFVRDRQQLR